MSKAGAFSRTRKPGCPYRARAVALGRCATGRPRRPPSRPPLAERPNPTAAPHRAPDQQRSRIYARTSAGWPASTDCPAAHTKARALPKRAQADAVRIYSNRLPSWIPLHRPPSRCCILPSGARPSWPVPRRAAATLAGALGTAAGRRMAGLPPLG